MAVRYSIIGCSRLFHVTTELETPVYVDIVEKQTAYIDKPGLLKLTITTDITTPLQVKKGEFGSIVLEGQINKSVDELKFVWNVEIKCQEHLTMSMLNGVTYVYLHFPGHVVQVQKKTWWGVKVERGQPARIFKLQVETVISKELAQLELIDLKEGD